MPRSYFAMTMPPHSVLPVITDKAVAGRPQANLTISARLAAPQESLEVSPALLAVIYRRTVQ